MSRPKGALNKRTRAALSAAAEGRLAEGAEQTLEYLVKIVQDTSRDDATRLQAANVLLPYVKPRLASIEQTNIDPRDDADPEQLFARMVASLSANPTFFDRLIVAVRGERETSQQDATLVAPQRGLH